MSVDVARLPVALSTARIRTINVWTFRDLHIYPLISQLSPSLSTRALEFLFLCLLFSHIVTQMSLLNVSWCRSYMEFPFIFERHPRQNITDKTLEQTSQLRCILTDRSLSSKGRKLLREQNISVSCKLWVCLHCYRPNAVFGNLRGNLLDCVQTAWDILDPQAAAVSCRKLHKP